jgi:hypothetical protein
MATCFQESINDTRPEGFAEPYAVPSCAIADRSHMRPEKRLSISPRDIADRAKEVAARSDGLRRRSALYVSVVASTSSTTAEAREALEAVPHHDLRAAAMSLLAELGAAPAGGSHAAE